MVERARDDRLDVVRGDAFGQRDQHAVDVVLHADALELVGAPEHPEAADGAAAQHRVVVDESDDATVAVHPAGELARERGAGVARTDDEGAQLVVGSHRSLSFEREQPGLEPDAAAAEQDDQRRDRRGREHGQRAVAQLVDHDELERRDDGPAGHREHDARGLLDGRVAPDRTVQTRELVRDELGDDRQREEEDRTARQVVRDRAFEAREVREQPRDGDHARVEDAQARVVEPARELVDGARESTLVTRRAHGRASDFGRCRSIHCYCLLLAARTRPGPTFGVTLGRTRRHGS